jgi:hypothetical protein
MSTCSRWGSVKLNLQSEVSPLVLPNIKIYDGATGNDVSGFISISPTVCITKYTLKQSSIIVILTQQAFTPKSQILVSYFSAPEYDMTVTNLTSRNLNQIKFYLSHALNTTGVDLTVKCLLTSS